MLIEDIRPGGKRPAPQATALKKMRQLHHATKISTIVSKPPQTRPQPNHPASVRAHSQATAQLKRKAATQNPIQTTPVQPGQRSTFQKQVSKPTTTKAARWRRLFDFVQYPLIAAVALLAAYNSMAGQVMIGLYALFAIFVQVSSKYTFGAALLLLVAIPTFQVLGESGVSEKCAIYAYELLVVGTLQTIIETWLENRKSKVKPTTSRA